MVRSLHTPAYELFRHLLTKAREDAGLTQMDVATQVSRPQSFVAKYEGGERRLDVLEYLEICAAIGADPMSILARLKEEIGK